MHPEDRNSPLQTAPERRRRSGLRVALLFLVLLSATAGAAYILGERWILEWSRTPHLLTAPTEIELAKGETLLTLSKELEERGLVSSAKLFQTWMRFYGLYSRFQAGPYRFEGAVSPQDIAATMTRGETYNPVVFQITVPEGATLQQIHARLAEGGVGTEEGLRDRARDPTLLRKLNIPSKTLEGFLYPATYPFSVIPTPEEAYSVMVEQFWKSLPPDYEKHIAERGLNLLEAVTFASLIELETAVEDERPLVSEVIWNRLKMKTALGIDAAIIYGIPNYKGDITWKHLQDVTNPYNLRVHAGLPPTPIGSPSLKSLLAVLQPSQFGYLYYVVDGAVPGRHKFAKTLAEHNRNVREYLKSRKQR